MGFDVFLQWHEFGGPASVPEHTVRKAFGEMLVSEDAHCLRLSEGDVYLGGSKDGGDGVSSVTVSRPTDSKQLWDAVYSLLRVGYGVFYFPGGGPLIASSQAAAHLPPELVETLGPAIVAQSGADLAAAIQDA